MGWDHVFLSHHLPPAHLGGLKDKTKPPAQLLLPLASPSF